MVLIAEMAPGTCNFFSKSEKGNYLNTEGGGRTPTTSSMKQA